VARASRPCVGCRIRTGETPVPLRWKRRARLNSLSLSTCLACESLNTYSVSTQGPNGRGEPSLAWDGTALRELLALFSFVPDRIQGYWHSNPPMNRWGNFYRHLTEVASCCVCTVARSSVRSAIHVERPFLKPYQASGRHICHPILRTILRVEPDIAPDGAWGSLARSYKDVPLTGLAIFRVRAIARSSVRSSNPKAVVTSLRRRAAIPLGLLNFCRVSCAQSRNPFGIHPWNLRNGLSLLVHTPKSLLKMSAGILPSKTSRAVDKVAQASSPAS